MSDGSLAVTEPILPEPRLRDVMTPRTMLIFAIALLTNVTMYMVHPFFVIYFKESLGFSIPEAGLLVALPFVSAVLFGMAGGYLSDRIGVLRTYTFAMAIYAVSIGAVGFVHSFVVAAILMLVSGLALPVISSGISTLVNDSAKPEHRGLLQNYLYWLNNVGIVVGLLVSAELLHAGHSNVPLIVLGFVRLLLCAVILLFFRESHSESSDAVTDVSNRPTMLTAFKLAGTDKALMFAACTMLLLMVMESQLDATMPLYFTEHFKHGVSLFGPIVTINAIVLVACQPIAVKLLSKKKSVPVFAVGALCTGVGLALGGVVGTVWAWIAGMLLYSFGEVIWSTKLNDLFGELPTPGNSTLYFGAIRTAVNIAFLIGMSLGTMAYHAYSGPVLFGSMVVIALMTIPLFRTATIEFKRRVVRDMVNADVVAEVTLPGTESIVHEPDTEEGVTSEASSAFTQGAASFMPPYQPPGQSVFGIPPTADRVQFLQNLSAEAWGKILSFTYIQRFSPGAMVLDMGEWDRSMYMVLSGQLEVLVPANTTNSDYRRLTVIETGSVFGEQTFIDGRPRSAFIRAITDGELSKLNWQSFVALSQNDPELGQTVMMELARILSERLRQTTTYLNLLYDA